MDYFKNYTYNDWLIFIGFLTAGVCFVLMFICRVRMERRQDKELKDNLLLKVKLWEDEE